MESLPDAFWTGPKHASIGHGAGTALACASMIRGVKQPDWIGSEDCSDTASGWVNLRPVVVVHGLPGCGFQDTVTVGVSSLIGSAWQGRLTTPCVRSFCETGYSLEQRSGFCFGNRLVYRVPVLTYWTTVHRP